MAESGGQVMAKGQFLLADFFASRNSRKPNKAFCSRCEKTIRAKTSDQLVRLVIKHHKKCK